MSNWSEIKTAFIDWLKTQEDYKEGENITRAQYSEQFKLFIEDPENNVDIDSFTRTTDQLEESRKAEEEKREELEDKEELPEIDEEKGEVFAYVETEGEENTLHDMFNYFLSSLNTNNEEDKKIIEAIDTNGDKIISQEERNVFIDKVITAGFDGNKEDLSFEDIETAIKKVENNETDFLKDEEEKTEETQQTQQTQQQGTTGTQGTTTAGTTATNPDIPNVEKLSELPSDIANYQPQEMPDKPINLRTTTLDNSYLKADLSSYNDSACITLQGNIKTEITNATANYNGYKAAFTTSNVIYIQSSSYIQENQSKYEEIIGALVSQDDNVRMANEQITSLEDSKVAAETSLNAQLELKDCLTSALSGVEGQIANLQGQLSNLSGEESSAQKTEIETQIANLEEEKNRLETELGEASKQIMNDQAALGLVCENLDLAYQNLNTAIQNSDIADDKQKETMNAIVENKKIMNQAYQDMKEAQAGMAAMDAYIIALEGKSEDVCARREQIAEEEENQEELEDNEPVEAEDEREYLEGVAGSNPYNAQNISNTTDDGSYSYSDGRYIISVKYNDSTGEYTYTYTAINEEDDDTKTLTIHHGTDENGEYDDGYVDMTIEDSQNTTGAQRYTEDSTDGQQRRTISFDQRYGEGENDIVHSEISSITGYSGNVNYNYSVSADVNSDGELDEIQSTNFYTNTDGSGNINPSWIQSTTIATDENGNYIFNDDGEPVHSQWNTQWSSEDGITTIRTSNIKDGKDESISTTYDSEGNVIERSNTITSNGVTTTTTETYENGELTQQTTQTFDSEGNVTQQTTQTFDSEGNVTERTIQKFDSEGELAEEIRTEYKNGEPTKEFVKTTLPDGNVENQSWFWKDGIKTKGPISMLR